MEESLKQVSMKPVISTKDLVKRYGKLEALRGLSIDVERGTAFCLLGPNGAGKSTAISILTGQIEPTSGNATVMGLDVTKDPIGVKRMIGIVPENENPPSFLTVREYLEIVCSIRNVSDPSPKIEWWIEFFSLASKTDVLCKDLSKGTKKKVLISASLVHEPELLFLDEPFLDLDPIIQRKFREYLKEYVTKGGTLFLSTHILEIAEKLCTRAAILNEGTLIVSGELSQLKVEKESLEDVFIRLVTDE